MFDKLRKAFSSAAKSIGQKELTEKLVDDVLLDLEIGLLESDVAQEVVDTLSATLKKELVGLKLEKGQNAEELIQSKFREAVSMIFARAGKTDVLDKIKTNKESKAGPFSIVFLGINGTGKTTTVAKFAKLLRRSGFTSVIAAGDTHRSGAIEQVSKHAENLSIKVIAQRYGADPSAVARDAVDYARKHYVDVVLIDTAGRMQTSKNLMDEMSKIVRVVKPSMKLFIGDALAGNDTINQAREFFQYTNFDGAILTKIDADAKGGAAISIAHITSKPILFVGMGQGYDDLVPFEPDKFVETLFGTPSTVTVEDLIQNRIEQSSPSSEEVEQPKPEVVPEPRVHTSHVTAPVQEPETREEVRDTQVIHEAKLSPAPEPIEEPRFEHLEKPKEEKKGRFSLFGRKKEKKKDEKHDSEQVKVAEKNQRKEDKDSAEREDKVIYLSDEDIEDLLK